jgi:hypothetical protein
MISPRPHPQLLKHVYQSLCLVLLLIAGQQGALVHELGHLSGAHALDLRASPTHAAETACGLCPSFAQVATPAFSPSFTQPQSMRPEPQYDTQVPIAAGESTSSSPRNRGPPSRS